eukprot:7293315-Prymnesium_polylepis.1
MEPGRAGGASLASSEAAHLRLGARVAPGGGRAENPGTRGFVTSRARFGRRGLVPVHPAGAHSGHQR